MSYLDEIAQSIRSKVPSRKLPHTETTGLFRAYAVLLLAKGEDVSAADVHNAWVAWMLERDDSHDALVPFDDLPEDVAAADEPYVEAIRTVAKEQDLGPLVPSDFDDDLFPTGIPGDEGGQTRLFELYRIMVASSEALVGRRQGVNTFFLTINGALLTAVGLVLSNGRDPKLQGLGLVVLAVTGCILAIAWNSLILSFGQLNKGKFKVINRIEQDLPAAIFLAEWKALGEGIKPSIYRTFTSREVWTPRVFLGAYVIVAILAALVAVGVWSPR
jgi:hypothetical protein